MVVVALGEPRTPVVSWASAEPAVRARTDADNTKVPARIVETAATLSFCIRSGSIVVSCLRSLGQFTSPSRSSEASRRRRVKLERIAAVNHDNLELHARRALMCQRANQRGCKEIIFACCRH